MTDCGISTPLWRLLSSNLAADTEIAEILSIPALHAEAKVVAERLEALGVGCGQEAVRRALQPLVLIYGLGEQAKVPMFWAVYVKALEDVPAQALAEAIEEYTGLGTSEFFPRPGPLRALALKHAAPIWKARDRARRAANSLPRPVITPADAEARKALIAETLRAIGSKAAVSTAGSEAQRSTGMDQ